MSDLKQLKQRQYRQQLRVDALTYYANGPPCCACCGEMTLEFLGIDHVNGGGNKHRKSGEKGVGCFWSWLRRNGYPTGFRVLCHNCNLARGFYGYCPHERSALEVVAIDINYPQNALYCSRSHPMFGTHLHFVDDGKRKRRRICRICRRQWARDWKRKQSIGASRGI